MTNKELAEHRAKLLWQRYHANEDHLTCKEVLEITSKRTSNVYHTFFVHGVKAPPVWDTKTAIRDRQIVALQAKATELGRNWLTITEASEATGVSSKNVYIMRTRLAGQAIPVIKNETNRQPVRKSPVSKNDNPSGISEDTDSRICGLLYYKALPGPKPGQTRYFLK